MITSMIRPMIRPMIRSMIPSSAITRYFTNLNGTDAYWEFQDTLVFASGDTFDIEHQFPTATLSDAEYICDAGSGSNRGNITLLSNGLFSVNTAVISELRVDGIPVALSSAYPIDGKIHLTSVTFSDLAEIKVLGKANFNLFFLSRILANPKANISGQTQTYTLGNAPGNDTELPIENVTGPEIWTNPPSSIQSYWTDDGGGVYSINAPDGAFNSVLMDSLPNGVYEVSFTVDSVSGVDSISAHADGVRISSDGALGKFTGLLTLTSGVISFARRGGAGAFTSTISSITIKSITNAITRINVVDADIELFTLTDDGWIGQEKIIGGDFNTPSDWTTTGSASVSGGLGLVDGTGGNSLILQDALTDGLTYIASFTANIIIDSTNSAVWNNSGATLYTPILQGSNNFSFTQNNVSGNYLFRANVGSYEVDNASVKQLIEIA